MVVATDEWPMRSWTVRMSVPFWRSAVAKLWRIEWQLAFFGISALRTASLNWIFEVGEDGGDFAVREHHRRTALRVAVARRFDGEILIAADFPGEEYHGIERLFLGRCRDVALQRQIVEVGGHSGGACVTRAEFELHQTEARETDVPMDVGFLSGVGETGEPDGTAACILRLTSAVNPLEWVPSDA